MFEHKLAEALYVERSTHAYEQFWILQVGGKPVENLCLAAVCLVKVVKLLSIFITLNILQFLLNTSLRNLG